MALIKCPECGKEISDKAKKCVHCGMSFENGIPQKKRCDECGKENDIEATECVFCGCPFEDEIAGQVIPVNGIKEEQKKKNKKIAIGAFVAVAIITIVGTEIKSSNQNVADGDAKNTREAVNLIESGTGEKNSSTTSTASDQNVSNIRQNTTISIGGLCEFNITGYDINDTIEPPRPTGYYTYYQADDGNTYIDVKMKIKNLKNTSMLQYEVLDSVKILYDGQYEYDCFFVVEEKNGESFNQYTSLYEINPLETLSYHMLASVPEEIKGNSKSLSVEISVNDKMYICNLR